MSDTTDEKANGADRAAEAPERDLGPSEYEPTDRENEAIGRWGTKRDTASPAPRIKIKQTGTGEYGIRYDHESQSLAELMFEEAIGSTDSDFRAELLEQVLNATTSNGKTSEKRFNFALSVIKGIKPVDVVETLLSTQMAIVHCALASYATRFGNATRSEEMERTEVAITKLARTFATQVEALKRYRAKGEQRVTVEHVHVHQGGQAIVGNVTRGSAGLSSRNEEPTHDANQGRVAIPAPDGAALPIDVSTHKTPMPAARGEGEAPLQVSRRSRDRRAKG